MNQKERCYSFFFPSDEYMGLLISQDKLMFYDEIDCKDLFANSKEGQRERIVIFEVV